MVIEQIDLVIGVMFGDNIFNTRKILSADSIVCIISNNLGSLTHSELLSMGHGKGDW